MGWRGRWSGSGSRKRRAEPPSGCEGDCRGQLVLGGVVSFAIRPDDEHGYRAFAEEALGDAAENASEDASGPLAADDDGIDFEISSAAREVAGDLVAVGQLLDQQLRGEVGISEELLEVVAAFGQHQGEFFVAPGLGSRVYDVEDGDVRNDVIGEHSDGGEYGFTQAIGLIGRDQQFQCVLLADGASGSRLRWDRSAAGRCDRAAASYSWR